MSALLSKPIKLQNNSFFAFTFIELLVSISVMILIMGVGTASFREYQRRQILESVVRQVVADLRLTQQFALSGKKNPSWNESDCKNLTGYIVQLVKNKQTYDISAYCDNDNNKKCKDNGILKNQNLCYKTDIAIPSSVEFFWSGGNHKDVIFYTLGKGTNFANFDLRLINDVSKKKTLNIDSQGVISVN